MTSKLRTWWNKALVTKVKHLAFLMGVVGLLFTSFQYQVTAQGSARERGICISRVSTRDDLRAVLFYVVDLSDIITDGRAANYTKNRVDYINRLYPALSVEDC